MNYQYMLSIRLLSLVFLIIVSFSTLALSAPLEVPLVPTNIPNCCSPDHYLFSVSSPPSLTTKPHAPSCPCVFPTGRRNIALEVARRSDIFQLPPGEYSIKWLELEHDAASYTVNVHFAEERPGQFAAVSGSLTPPKGLLTSGSTFEVVDQRRLLYLAMTGRRDVELQQSLVVWIETAAGEE
ncbi:MAG: hypothetical protein M1836_004985 [Candelina mexicana]|nr:MAG: hypothetical protein M1836_004985 [Candelina mexicana]